MQKQEDQNIIHRIKRHGDRIHQMIYGNSRHSAQKPDQKIRCQQHGNKDKGNIQDIIPAVPGLFDKKTIQKRKHTYERRI